MRSQTLFRLSGWALTIGAALFAIGYILKPGMDDVIQVYTNPLYIPAVTFSFLGALLVLVGLPALYAHQASRAGILGLVSFVLVFLGLASLEIGSGPLLSIVSQMLAAEPATQSIVASGGALENNATFLVFYLPSLLTTNLGILLFGISTIRAGVFPRWAGWLMIAGVLLVFVVETVGIPLVMAGMAWCGLALAGAAGQRTDLVETAAQAA